MYIHVQCVYLIKRTTALDLRVVFLFQNGGSKLNDLCALITEFSPASVRDRECVIKWVSNLIVLKHFQTFISELIINVKHSRNIAQRNLYYAAYPINLSGALFKSNSLIY